MASRKKEKGNMLTRGEKILSLLNMESVGNKSENTGNGKQYKPRSSFKEINKNEIEALGSSFNPPKTYYEMKNMETNDESGGSSRPTSYIQGFDCEDEPNLSSDDEYIPNSEDISITSDECIPNSEDECVPVPITTNIIAVNDKCKAVGEDLFCIGNEKSFCVTNDECIAVSEDVLNENLFIICNDECTAVREDIFSVNNLPASNSNDTQVTANENLGRVVSDESMALSKDTVEADSNKEIKAQKKKIFAKKEKVSRKRIKKIEEWKKHKAMLARERGQSYVSQKGKNKPAKLPNFGMLCSEKCRLECNSKFKADVREKILQSYYQLDVNAKNVLLFKSITIQSTARHRNDAKKHKLFSYKYSVSAGKETIPVCKRAICSLYQISRKKVDIIHEKLKAGENVPSLDQRGHHNNRPHKVGDDVIQCITAHINKFPAESSHYSRHNNPHRKYLSSLLDISKMHRLYLEECNFENRPSRFMIKRCTYAFIFSTKFNLSFKEPRSDTCSKCDSNNRTEEHVESYKSAFDAQKSDREKASSDPNVCYLTLDLQQTMPLPKLTTSKAFYLRQLWFYNVGIHSIMSDENKAYMLNWTEDVAGRGSTEICSSLLAFVERNEALKNRNHLVVWSDSCSGQNKNFNMLCLYQYMIFKGYLKIIDHKFPEVGHSYLDSDRDFGRIEKELRKHETIFTPEKYREIIKNASVKSTVVIDMENHFRDIENLRTMLQLFNRKKNSLNEIVPFRDGIKWIRVEEFGKYLYKENYDPYCPFKQVCLFKKDKNTMNQEPITIARLTKKGNVSAEKRQNLKEQLSYVKEECRWFYEKIINSKEGDDTLKKTANEERMARKTKRQEKTARKKKQTENEERMPKKIKREERTARKKSK